MLLWLPIGLQCGCCTGLWPVGLGLAIFGLCNGLATTLSCLCLLCVPCFMKASHLDKDQIACVLAFWPLAVSHVPIHRTSANTVDHLTVLR